MNDNSETSTPEASPLGKSRYGRTRKPKISEDFCNIDDVFNEASTPPRGQRSPQKSPVQKAAGKSKVAGASPLPGKPVVVMESLFMPMPKQIQPLPKQITPQRVPMDTLDVDLPKVVSVPLKERKFFKSNSEASGGDGVDVTDVLKIIKSDHSEPPAESSKPSAKPVLRTYGNKRKLTTKTEVVVVESFALPDNPIVPATVETKEVIDISLPDASSTENKELPTNSIDIKENDVNSCTLKLNYNVVFDEVCIKADECMMKGTTVKQLHDGSETEKHTNGAGTEQEKTEMANGIKDKKRKKLSLNVSEGREEVVQGSKKSKVNEAENDKNLTPQSEESTSKTDEKVVVEETVTLKRKRGRPRKNQTPLSPESAKKIENDLQETTSESITEESDNNLSLTESVLKKIKKFKTSEQTEDTAKNTETPLKNSSFEKQKDSKNNLETPEKQLRSGKIVNTEEKAKKAEEISPIKKKRGRPPLDKSLAKQLKQEKMFEHVEEETSPQKTPNKKKLRAKSDFVSPARTLRSSVILVEKPTEIVDLTGNDADMESSDEEIPKQSEKKVLEKLKEGEKSEKVDVKKKIENEERKPNKSGSEKEEKKLNKSVSEKVGGKRATEKEDEKKKLNKSGSVKEEKKLNKSVGGKRATEKDEKKLEDEEKMEAENVEIDCSKVKEEPTEELSTVKLEPCDYAPGDLMWARIGNYPFWPCMITTDPESKLFKKERIIGRTGSMHIFHVRFFGDKGRRAWVQFTNMIPFTKEHDLDVLAKTASFANKSAYIVPPAKVPKWKTAVQEALSVQNKTTQERFDFFFNMFATKREKKLKLMGIAENMRRKQRNIKHKVSPRKPPAFKSSSFRRSSSRLSKLIKTDMTVSECSLSDTDTSSKFSVNSTNSLEAQAALYKRNNIFKGAYKGRVCEICEKQDEIFKCKECAGYFHATCARIVAEDGEIPNNNKKTVKEADVADDCAHAQQEEKAPVADDCAHAQQEEQAPVAESSSKPDVTELSLQKRIDLRMKEIMKKFDYTSVYADSASDSEQPEDDGETENTKESSKSDLTEKKIIQHVTADCITFAELETDPKPPPPEVITPKPEEVKIETASVSSTEDVLNKKTFKCFHCRTNNKPPCFVCNKSTDVRKKCSMYSCGKFYHVECLKQWPQTRTPSNDSFVCPMHVCHTCVSDDPRGACSRHPTDNLVRCIKCPSTYHSSSYCLPAGTVILSTKQVVCVRHVQSTKFNKTVNTTWCFLCALGGDLICCETCPTSVHVKCLKIDLSQTDKYICDDCESGRYPLYDEIVWVKLGKYRWWPSVILFPNEVPERVNNMPHTQGEFVVRFYGTHDHYWVSRGRVFLFEDGDQEHMGRATKKMDLIFKKAVEEAIVAFQLKQSFKTAREAEMRSSLKPPAYIRIKTNKPVGNVRQFDGNTSNATACDCDANQPFPCGPDSDCLNRLLLTECDPTVCPAGERCNNQRFEKRQYPPLLPHKTQGRGWGLKTLAPIAKGQFVIEYVGELIDDQEYQRRIQKMHEQKEENYYFLTIDNNRTIDAGPKGNMARFMNHSCQPNCETQKWTVNGDTRVGLFATDDIPAGAELTFNYNLECVGKEKKICRCGAPNCSGFIGVKAKNNSQDEVQKKPKRLLRKKKSPPPIEPVEPTENFCFVCNESGDVMGCHNKICNNYYHLKCVALREWPDGKWVCPWHNCNICAKRTIRCCVKCLNSYCPAHSEGYIRHDRLLGFVCFEHDPTKESPVAEPAPTQPETSNTSLQTEETDITSTTLDDLNTAETKDPDTESIKPEAQEETAAGGFKDLPSSTPLKKRRDSTAEDSDDVPQTSAVVAEKNKKGRKKKYNKKVQHEVKVLPVRAVKNLLNSSVTIQNEVKLTPPVPTRHLRTVKRTSDGCMSEFEKFLKKQQLDFEKNLPIRKRSRARCETTL